MLKENLNQILVKDLLVKVLVLNLDWISVHLINPHLLLWNLLWKVYHYFYLVILKVILIINSEILSISVSSLDSVKLLVNYFNKYPLIGNKLNDFKKWEIVYYMFIKKEHLTDEGRLKIKSLIGKL